MASNQTPNLGLSQWQRTDPFTMDEFNADYAKIDAALGAQPYKVLLRQTLAQNASSILLDLSGIDFTEHPRLRLEVTADIVGTTSPCTVNMLLYCNDLTDGYYYLPVGEATTPSVKEYYNIGTGAYENGACNIIQLSADIYVAANGLNLRSICTRSSGRANTLFNCGCHEICGYIAGVGQSSLESLRIAFEGYSSNSTLSFCSGASATLISVI